MTDNAAEVKPLEQARKRLQRKAATVKVVPKKPKPARMAATRATQGKRLVDVVLTMPHWVNGKNYGPGRVRVPESSVSGFLDTEQRVRQNDANMMGRQAAFIGPGNRKMPVPYEHFDSPLLNVLEAMQVS
jgi:hypothetical protein